MLLAQGRFWRIEHARSNGPVRAGLLRDLLGDESKELRDFHLEIPLEKWGRVFKHIRSDRKLLGGLLLEDARPQDQLAAVLGNDRLYAELQRVLLDASATLVESGRLLLTPVDGDGQ
jgi:hypothetical protein